MENHISFCILIPHRVYSFYNETNSVGSTWGFWVSVNSCSFVKVSEHLIKSTHLLNFLNSYLTCPDQNVPQDSLATGQHSLITPRRRGTGVNILPHRQKVTRLIFENCNKYHMMFSRIKRHTAEKICINFDKCASN